METDNGEQLEGEALENTPVDAGPIQEEMTTTPSATAPSGSPHSPKRTLILKVLSGLLVLVLLAGIGSAFQQSRKSSVKTEKTVTINTQSLDNGTLNKLTTQTSKDGAVQQQLTISPKTLFKSDVTVQG